MGDHPTQPDMPLDIHEITQRLIRDSTALDTRTPELLRESFTADTRFEYDGRPFVLNALIEICRKNLV